MKAPTVLATLFLVACSSSSTTTDGGTSSDGGSRGDAGNQPTDPEPTAWRAAVGTGGAFVQTFDGASWLTRTIADRSLFDVDCVTDAIGWAVGEGGYVAHTVDSGVTWTRQEAKASGALRTVAFADERTGIVAGDAGTLAVTHDGGATWTMASLGTTATFRAASVRAGLFVVVGDGGVIARAETSVSTWTTSTIAGAGNLRGVTFGGGASVLTVDDAGRVWSSDDGSVPFVVAATAAAPLTAISSDRAGTHVFAVGLGGTLIAREDGAPWAARDVGSSADLRSVLATEEGLVYVAGDAGTLRVGSGAGRPFRALASGTHEAILSLDNL